MLRFQHFQRKEARKRERGSEGGREGRKRGREGGKEGPEYSLDQLEMSHGNKSQSNFALKLVCLNLDLLGHFLNGDSSSQKGLSCVKLT